MSEVRTDRTPRLTRHFLPALVVLIGLGHGSVAIGQMVHNVTQGSDHFLLQEALNDAANGDVIEINAGTLFEDNIRFPNAIDVTIRGAGREETSIDGGGGNDGFPILNMDGTGQTNATVISDLTLTNGVNTVITGGGAVRVSGASSVFRNVTFSDNRGPNDNNGAAHLRVVDSANLRFENCAFLNGSEAFDSVGFLRSTVTLLNCLLVADSTATGFKFDDGEITLINCTISAAETRLGRAYGAFNSAVFRASNSIFEGDLIEFGENDVTTSRCLFVGAQGDNVDGVPTFESVENLDFRLAAGSPGIDAGDNALLPAGVTTDHQGLPRIIDDPATLDSGREGCTVIDIGAFEFQSFTDSDDDGVQDACDVCVGNDAAGDSDDDGICEDLDACVGDDASGDADDDGACDDLDACAGNDAVGDSDGDGTCDDVDLCRGSDPSGDSDDDGVCDDLDLCTGDDAAGDSDGDGACDDVDLCRGSDVSGDSDADGTCDDRDACIGNDASGDSDRDGVCDDRDQCRGNDADGDADGDGVCDDLDQCTGNDASGDADSDDICDDTDLCAGDNALGDADGDGLCDAPPPAANALCGIGSGFGLFAPIFLVNCKRRQRWNRGRRP